MFSAALNRIATQPSSPSRKSSSQATTAKFPLKSRILEAVDSELMALSEEDVLPCTGLQYRVMKPKPLGESKSFTPQELPMQATFIFLYNKLLMLGTQTVKLSRDREASGTQRHNY